MIYKNKIGQHSFVRIAPSPPHYSPNALLYEITPRVMDPAKPRPLHPEYVKQYLEVDDEQTKMKRARAYVPTERILKLAQPRYLSANFFVYTNKQGCKKPVEKKKP